MNEKEYYDLQASEAGTWDGAWADQMLEALKESVKDLPKDAKILDIGCHTGRSLFELKKWGFANAVGVDLVTANSMEAGKKGLTVLTMNMENLNMLQDGGFDFGFMSHAIEHSRDPVKAVKEMTRVCKSGLIICPLEEDKHQPDGPTPHTSPYYTREQWISDWEDGCLIAAISHTDMNRLGKEIWTRF